MDIKFRGKQAEKPKLSQKFNLALILCLDVNDIAKFMVA